MGVSSKVLSWIKCFLYDRVQCVCVNNHFSSYLPVLSGVPQSSILVPLLFVAYIDEGVKISNLHGTSNGMYLYADVAKLFSNNIDNLQSALNRLSAWLCSRQLNLAPANCEHLHISRSNNSLDHSFQVCFHTIKTVKPVKILVFLFPIILNGLNISITFILLLLCVLVRSCVLFLLKMFGPCLKLLLLMFAPNWNIILQFGIHILKKTHSFWSLYKKSLPVMCFYAAIFHFTRMLID